MSCFRNLFNLSWMVPALLAVPVLAHTVKVSGEVAATFHIEPGHNPIAGKPSLAWFALTQKGGRLIPLSQCNCELGVYPSSNRNANAAPLLKPTLKTVNAEKYKGVIGATVTFPKAGQYKVELRGTAKSPANFKPFRLSYTVTVGGSGGSNQTHMH